MTTRRQEARLATVLEQLRDGGWEPGLAAGWDEERTLRNYRIILDSGTTMHNLPLACVAVELLALHEPDTVRGNMYLVVSAGWLPDTSQKSYDRIQRLLNRLRERGTISFDWVRDSIRSTIKPSSWSELSDFAETVRDAYRRDFWAALPEYVEIIIEKDTIAGKVVEVTSEYDVPLQPLRGYSSSTFAWNIAQAWKQIDKPITCYYIGDHDPSGRDLERSVRDKLARYSEKQFRWLRLGVNPEQFEQFNIILLAPKKKGTRYERFVSEWGPNCAEAEAIPANTLRELVRDAIENHVPHEEWKRLQRVEELEREQWHELMGQLSS